MDFGINSIIIPLFLIVLFFLFLLAGLKVKGSNWFSPWSITCLVWIGILILFVFYNGYLNPLKGSFYFSLFLWVVSFFFSSVFSYSFFVKRKKIPTFYMNNSGLNILLLVSLAFSPVFLYVAYRALGGSYDELFSDLRGNAADRENWGALVYLKTLNQVLLVAFLWALPNISKVKIAYVFIINVLFAFVIMEKGSFFFIIIAALYIFYEKKYISKKAIVISLGVFVVLSYLFNELRNPTGTKDTEFMDFFAIYIMSPSVAFEQLSPGSSSYFGASTLLQLYKISNFFFDTDYITVSKLKDFVFIPLPTNVFTVMQPYYEDFGYCGIFSFGVINGLIMGIIYKGCVCGNSIMKCLYVYVMVILLLQFFQENFIVSFSVFVQFYIFSYLLLKPYRIRKQLSC